MIYLSIFSVAILCTALAEWANHKKKVAFSLMLSICAILVLAILGGLRDKTIGTDVLYYVKGNYDLAVRSASFTKYYTSVYAKEPLYLLCVYIVAKIFENFQILLFILQLITVGCVYCALWRMRDSVSPWFALLVYCALYYNDSFNMVRQHMAMAIVLLGSTFIVEEKYKKSIFCTIIATLIHFPAVISLLNVCLYGYLQKKKVKKDVSIRELVLFVVAIVGVLGVKTWSQVLIKFGLLSSRYLYYFSHESTSGHYLDTLIYLIEICYLITNSKTLSKRMKNYNFYKLIALFNVIFLQLVLFMNYGHRISLYFGIVNVMTIGQIPKTIYKASNRIITYLIVVVIALSYWLRIYYFGGVSNTIPYIFYNR